MCNLPDVAEKLAHLQAFTKKGARYDPAEHGEMVAYSQALIIDSLLSADVCARRDARF